MAIRTFSWRQTLCGLKQAVAWVLALSVAQVAMAQDTLRVLTWPGYADPDLVKVFEQQTGSKVEVTTIDSDDVMWQKLNKNKADDFDVFAVNTAELQRYIKGGLAVPVRTANIPNTARQLPRFRDLKGIAGLVHGDKAYAIPYTYAEMGLIFDKQQVKPAPTSIRALWEPRYRGKVLLYNGGSHNFSLAAQAMGDTTPYQLGNAEWPAVVDHLINLRRNAQGFYTQPEESVEMFKNGHTAIMFANYGSQQVQLLKRAGIDVGYVVPQEGALAWLDCWAITRGAKNTQLAEAWINYMLETAPGQALLTRQGLANTTSESPYLRAQDRLLWLEPVENVDRRAKLWERIIAGDRASKVLAP
ncbi:extracellular solute-binding protein [Rhodoferax sp. AJA081-3]|uniref:extracellular solute-binding protein n=1 Tax=Rhodoferax sp. AJA081-3 TaxID=2752316 RepID=UPI001ADF9CE8|nr:extracellular solute-binding protein [Rhodoferax sp. AJA081-3]QTN28547.1 extracellular solute-binding protein [Rhodoferax sp. AJA081-3]